MIEIDLAKKDLDISLQFGEQIWFAFLLTKSGYEIYSDSKRNRRLKQEWTAIFDVFGRDLHDETQMRV